MASKQKTFSVGLTRNMAPQSRIVAYTVVNGEIISDSINFFVNGSLQNPVSSLQKQSNVMTFSANKYYLTWNFTI